MSRLRPEPVPRSAPARLSERVLALRARRLRLVLSDCDGVLTDGSVYVSANGEEQKRFSMRDGMGVERLREAGIETAIVTRERSPVVARRAEKLGVRLFAGVLDKRLELPRILELTGRACRDLAYIGDDLNDLGVLQLVADEGLAGAPADAQPSLLGVVHYHCRTGGGVGAFREFAEWLLSLRSGVDAEGAA